MNLICNVLYTNFEKKNFSFTKFLAMQKRFARRIDCIDSKSSYTSYACALLATRRKRSREGAISYFKIPI